MFRTVLIIKLILSFSLISYAQTTDSLNKPTLLIYSKEPGFLVPYIEKELINLTTINDSIQNDLYFASVNSFNRIQADGVLESAMSKLVWSQDNVESLINLELETEGYSNEIVNVLIEYNYFLTIKTNTLGELIEFQLQLFETDPLRDKKNKGNVRQGTLKSFKTVQNFFINPKNPDYLFIIKNALYRLFENTNKPPISIVKIFGEIVDDNEKVIVPLNDPFLLDGSGSYDIDSEDLTYKWKSMPKEKENYQTFEKIELNPDFKKQKIEIKKAGIYRVLFITNDGITNSESKEFYLKTTKKPDSIKTSNSKFLSYSYGSGKYPRPKINQQGNFGIILEPNTLQIDTTNIILTNRLIGQKYVKEFHHEYEVPYSMNKKIKYLSDRASSYQDLIIQSEFDSKKNDELTYYLYRRDENGILSNPTVLTHHFRHYNGISMRMGSGFSLLSNRDLNPIILDSQGDTLRDSNSAAFINLEIAGKLSPRIELGGYVNIPFDNNVDFGEYSVDVVSILGIFSNYYFQKEEGHLGLYAGVEGGLTAYETYFNETTTRDIAYTYGVRVGATAEVIHLKKLTIGFGFKISIGYYNKSILNDLAYTNMSVAFRGKL